MTRSRWRWRAEAPSTSSSRTSPRRIWSFSSDCTYRPPRRGRGPVKKMAAVQQAAAAPNLNQVLREVAKDKGIDVNVLIATLEDAMKTAAKRHFGQDRNLEAKFNADKGV